MNVAEAQEKALSEIDRVSSLPELDKVRLNYLGRNGIVNRLLSEIPELPRTEDRKKAG
ncbi:MAG: hypothetical protein WD159_00835 [Patescibacteria group bacterium]